MNPARNAAGRPLSRTGSIGYLTQKLQPHQPHLKLIIILPQVSHGILEGIGGSLLPEIVIDFVDDVVIDGLADIIVEVELRAGGDDSLYFGEEFFHIEALGTGYVLKGELAVDALDDEELVAVITAAISSFNNKRFVIKSIRERKSSVWSIVDRLGNNKNFRL